MKQAYDFNRLINNIYFLGKVQGVPMAKLEKELGLSNGYFYRNKISTKPRNIGIETVIDVAEYFKVDLEKLLYCNMEEEN